MMQRIARVAASMTLLLAPVLVTAAELPFVHFTSGRGPLRLPSASVQRISQDSSGYIWLAFFSTGIARYNGHSIETFGSADGLPGITARDMAHDRDGRLWVATDSGLAASAKPLPLYAPGERVSFVTRFGEVELVKTSVRRGCIRTDRDGNIWIGTTGSGVLRYRFRRDGQLEMTSFGTDFAEPGSHSPVPGLVVRRDGTVWAALSGRRLMILSPTAGGEYSRKVLPLPGDVFESDVSALLETRDGTLLGGTQLGTIWRFSDAGMRFELLTRTLTAWVSGLFEARDGTVWGSSLGSGVVRITNDGAEVTHLTRSQGLLGETVWNVFQDRDGNLWFGQNGGLSRLRPDYRAFTAYSGPGAPGERPRLVDPSVFSIIPPVARGDARGAWEEWIWAGTGGGVTVLAPDGRSASLTHEDGLRANAVWATARDHAGRYWIGSLRGINCIVFGPEDPELRSFPRRKIEVLGETATLYDIESDRLYAIRSRPLPAAGGPIPAVWFAHASGLRVFVDGELHHLGTETGLPASGTSNVELDQRGYLWVTTLDHGVFRSVAPMTAEVLRDQTRWGEVRSQGRRLFRPAWNRQRGAASDIAHTAVAAGGRLWIGSDGELVAFEHDRSRPSIRLDRSSGLGGSNVVAIGVTPDGKTLWVAQNGGLAAVDAATGRVLRTITHDDGLLDDEAWGFDSVSVSAEGTVYLGTTRGISVVRPGDVESRSPALPVVLEKVTWRTRPSGLNEIAFEFAALSFGSESRLRYRTRLEGFDEEWTAPQSEPRIRYTNLTAALVPKEYRFNVAASLDGEAWSAAPLEYQFTVDPPLWLAWWSVLVYVAGFAFALALFHKLRLARLKEKNVELERAVVLRTAEIREKADELGLLEEIVRMINREVELEKVLDVIIRQGLLLFPQAEKAAFVFLDHETDRAFIVASSGYERAAVEQFSLSAGDSLRRYHGAGQKLAEGIYIVRNPEVLPRHGSAEVPNPRVMLVMEASHSDRTEGFLVFDNFSDSDAFSSSDVKRLGRFREHVTSAIVRARTLRELEQKNREAERASRAKSAFLANMSHELRTPLNSIIGFAEILAERLEQRIDGRQIGFLRIIESSGRRLLTLINDLLDVSKIEAGKMELTVDEFSPAEEIGDVCELLRGAAGRAGIEIVTLVEPLPPVRSDAIKFRHIVSNLVSNAVKFSHSGSAVSVRARVVGAADVEMIELSVEDRGIGIEPSAIESIFEEFRQLDTTPARKHEGTGLGLSLVRSFVHLLGGQVSVESAPGEGSTFTVTIPVAAPAAPPQIPPAGRLTIIDRSAPPPASSA
jgi:signal transduction histidine kinase/ligand-binding sensor domain-containing protein